jgi:transposase
MRQKSVHPESPSERIVKNIRRATRKRHSSEEKIRIVLDGLRGEASIAELCRREGNFIGQKHCVILPWLLPH